MLFHTSTDDKGCSVFYNSGEKGWFKGKNKDVVAYVPDERELFVIVATR